MAIGVLIIVGYVLYEPLRVYYAEVGEQRRLEQQLADVRERNAELRERVDRLKTPEGIEEAARSGLGMVKEGENLYIVLDGEGEPAGGSQNEEAHAEGGPSPVNRALDLLFGAR